MIERFSRDDSKKKALAYLRRWGDKFWIDADERVKELTEKLEKAIQLQGNVAGLSSRASLEATFKHAEEAKHEFVERCQYVLNQVQASDLAGIVDLTQACLNDEQRHHFIVIDKLDDDWVDNSYKAALIRGLIRSVRAFAKVRCAKVIVALRHDLLERVFEDENLTAQREHFEGLFYSLRWGRSQLTRMLDERVNKLVRSRYSASQRVTHRDVMVSSLGGKRTSPSPLDYMLDRTLNRPRDLIAFFNECIKAAGDVPKVTADVIKRAERAYSQSRLNALDWEWKLNYHNLRSAAQAVLGNGPESFVVGDFSDETCIGWITAFTREDGQPAGPFGEAASQFDKDFDGPRFRRTVIWHLYNVGLVGLKTGKAVPFEFASDGVSTISLLDILDSTRVTIHRAFWRALGIREAAFPG